MQHKVYLSRRNIKVLLSKLDGKRNGQLTACTIVKNDDEHPTHPQTLAQIAVTAVEDGQDADNLSYASRLVISRTNLVDLLAELDRGTSAPIIRTMEITGSGIEVHCVEDAIYYQTRAPGVMHPLNDPAVVRH